MNDFVLVRKNLFRKKLRAGLMIVSIFVAFLIFGMLASFYRAFTVGEEVAAADRLVVVNKINFTQPLPVAYANRIRGIDGVAQLTHANWFGGYFQDPKNFLIVFAVDPENYMDLYSDDLDFPAEARRAFVRDRSGAQARMEGRRPYSDLEPDLLAEERRPHLGLHHRRHFQQPADARRHQFHDLPVRLF
jgi:putative ABC transport system permease protein